MNDKLRCSWPQGKPNDITYHDNEWGVPVHDDRKLFEFLVLDAFQAGLSWSTILNKRENFRMAFDNFNADIIAQYDAKKIEELLRNSGIIRNQLKIRSTITNAQHFLEVQKEFGRFDKYIWQFTGGRTIVNHWDKPDQVPASSKESDAMSGDLKKRGFRFVGSAICYAFMQAAGMVNDHLIYCFRHDEINKM
jgi:DNA-3-methyladenine glycosylase I